MLDPEKYTFTSLEDLFGNLHPCFSFKEKCLIFFSAAPEASRQDHNTPHDDTTEKIEEHIKTNAEKRNGISETTAANLQTTPPIQNFLKTLKEDKNRENFAGTKKNLLEKGELTLRLSNNPTQIKLSEFSPEELFEFANTLNEENLKLLLGNFNTTGALTAYHLSPELLEKFLDIAIQAPDSNHLEALFATIAQSPTRVGNLFTILQNRRQNLTQFLKKPNAFKQTILQNLQTENIKYFTTETITHLLANDIIAPNQIQSIFSRLEPTVLAEILISPQISSQILQEIQEIYNQAIKISPDKIKSGLDYLNLLSPTNNLEITETELGVLNNLMEDAVTTFAEASNAQAIEHSVQKMVTGLMEQGLENFEFHPFLSDKNLKLVFKQSTLVPPVPPLYAQIIKIINATNSLNPAQKESFRRNSIMRREFKNKGSQNYPLPEKLPPVDQFSKIEGHEKIQKILEKSPFNLPGFKGVEKALAIMTEGRDNFASMQNIFEQMNGFPSLKSEIREKIKPNSLLYNFSEAQTILSTPEEQLTEEQWIVADLLFANVIIPCYELLRAMADSRYEEIPTDTAVTRNSIQNENWEKTLNDFYKKLAQRMKNQEPSLDFLAPQPLITFKNCHNQIKIFPKESSETSITYQIIDSNKKPKGEKSNITTPPTEEEITSLLLKITSSINSTAQLTNISLEHIPTFTIEQEKILNDCRSQLLKFIESESETDTAQATLEKFNELSESLQKEFGSIPQATIKFNLNGNGFVWQNPGGFLHDTREDALFNRLLELRTQKLSQDKRESFIAKSRTAFREYQQRNSLAQMDSNNLLADPDLQKNYALHRDIHYTPQIWAFKANDYFQNNRELRIAYNYWKAAAGSQYVETLLKSYPYNLDSTDAPRRGLRIFAQGALQRGKLNFTTLFDELKDLPFIKNLDIPSNHKESGSSFQTAYKELKKIDSSRHTLEQKKILSLMEQEIIPYLLQLANAFTAIKPRVEGKIFDQYEIDSKKIQPLDTYEQEEIAPLRQLFTLPSDIRPNPLRAMSQLNGDHHLSANDQFTPEAALVTFLNLPGLYQIDPKTGKKILNKNKIIEKVNDLLRRGHIILNGANAINRTTPYSENQGQITSVSDIDKLTPEQKECLQIAFLGELKNEQTTASDKLAELINDPDLSTTTKNLLQEIAKNPKITGEELETIKNKLTLAGGLIVDTQGRITSAGLGAKIQINDDLAVSFGGGSASGTPAIGAGISARLYGKKFSDNDEVNINLHAGFSTFGIASGASVSATNNTGVTGEFSAGVLATYSGQIIPVASFSLSWEKAIIANRQNESTNSSRIAEIGTWEEWKNLNAQAKLAKIKQSPELQNRLQMTLTRENDDNKIYINGLNTDQKNQLFLEILDQYFQTHEENTATMVRDALYLPTGIGLGVAIGPNGTPTPLLGLKINIANTVIFIPHPRESEKKLQTLSGAAIEAFQKKWYKLPENSFQYTEKTADLYYKPGTESGIGVRTYHDDANLTKLSAELSARSVENKNQKINEELAKIDLSMKFHEPGQAILNIYNTEDKETEIFVDPLLDNLKVYLVNSQNIVLAGNLDDLIISRERITFPAPINNGQANIRDIITIKQKASLDGNRDRSWIEEYSHSRLTRTVGRQSPWRLEQGLGTESDTATIRTINNTDSEIELEIASTEADQLSTLRAGTPDSANLQTLPQIWNVRAAQLKALKENDYANLEGLTAQMKTKLENIIHYKRTNPSNSSLVLLYKKFSSIVDKPQELSQFVKTALTDNDTRLNEKQINEAVTYMLDLWFTDLFNKVRNKERPTQAEIEKIHQSIRASIEGNKKAYLSIFKTKIQELKEKNIKITSPPDQLVDLLFEETYDQLLSMEDPQKALQTLQKFEQIPLNSTLFSGTRLGGAWERGETQSGTPWQQVVARTLYSESSESERGFISATIKNLQLNDTDTTKKELALLLFELADPFEKIDDLSQATTQKWQNFLNSPLTVKMLGTQAFALLFTEKENKEINMILEKSSNLDIETITKNFATLKKLYDYLQKIREAQKNGDSYEVDTPTAGIKFKIDFKHPPQIQTGAYSKCANMSYSVLSNAQITISHKTDRGINTSSVTMNQVIENTPAVWSLPLAGAIGITPTSTPHTNPASDKNPNDGPDATQEP